MSQGTGLKGKMISFLVLACIVGAGYWWVNNRAPTEEPNHNNYQLTVTFDPTYQDPGPMVTVKVGSSVPFSKPVQNSPWTFPVTVPHGTGLLLKVTQLDPGFFSCSIMRNGGIVDARSRRGPGEVGCLTVA